MRDFESWLGQFRQSIATFDYYIDFGKVVAMAKRHKADLHLLNSLIGEQDIEARFRVLVNDYPNVMRCIPALLAVRSSEIYGRDVNSTDGKWYDFERQNCTLDEYCEFMNKTGLFTLISHHMVNNLYDYVLGVETGLDSNGRKSRGGNLMEDIVEGFLKAAKLRYHKEMYASDIEDEYGVDLAPITNNGNTKKRFDFVVKTTTCVYAIETNFYSGGGSKLNETARSYKMLALESKSIEGFKFVWFTDGAGWRSARQNLRETFEVLPDLYNIKDLEDGIARNIFV